MLMNTVTHVVNKHGNKSSQIGNAPPQTYNGDMILFKSVVRSNCGNDTRKMLTVSKDRSDDGMKTVTCSKLPKI